MAVTCKIEAECYYQTFVQVDSFGFLSPQPRKAWERWRIFPLDSRPDPVS